MNQELVVLVDEKNTPIGTALKSEVHQKNTPLHRAFSAFLFDPLTKKLLLQQRSFSKKTWPGVWSNSVCGHPLPGENLKETVIRRTAFELGATVDNLSEILPEFRYCAEFLGVQENEICPVWCGVLSSKLQLNSEEVGDTKWVIWDDFLSEILDDKNQTWNHLSPWCLEEVRLLSQSSVFLEWHKSVLK